MENLSPIMLGFLGSLAAGSLTAVGAIPVLFGRIPSRATRDPGVQAEVDGLYAEWEELDALISA